MNDNTDQTSKALSTYRLEIKGVSKSFPGVKALDEVNLKLKPGSIHALMGENGAGKSTLMKCLFGIYTMDSGDIFLDDQPVLIQNPTKAISLGIAMVHQELQPIPKRSIAENIFCGRYPMRRFGPIEFTDDAKMVDESKKWLNRVHLDIDPRTNLGELSISQMQLVEIAKAISIGARVLIMDEPTSSLTESEVDLLFLILNELRESGVSIIYISHKMEEILRISDEVTIMRDGKYVGTWESCDISIDFIISKMVGRELGEVYPPKHNVPKDVVFKVENLTSILPKSFKNISFDLREGEILGFAGLVGAGRTELMEAIFGMRKIAKGHIYYKNKKLEINHPAHAIKNKLALVTEDRRATGIFGVLSVSDNIAIASIEKYLGIGGIDQSKIDDVVEKNIERLRIKTPSAKTLIKSLSGGNQQKVIFARWLANDPNILILDEPTRGIDVGAKYEIYQIMLDLVNEGKSIIMISSEMPELLGVADRIAVMCDGLLTGIVQANATTQTEIMQLATKFN